MKKYVKHVLKNKIFQKNVFVNVAKKNFNYMLIMNNY